METTTLLLIGCLCIICLLAIGSVGAITYLKEQIKTLKDEVTRIKGVGSGIGSDSDKSFRYEDRQSSC